MILLLAQLLVIIAMARALGAAFQRLGQPAVIGEMAAGIVLGPSLFGWLAPDIFARLFPAESLGALALLSQIAVGIFMFTVGLDLNVREFRRQAPAALAVSQAAIALPFLLGFALAWPLFDGLAGASPRATPFAFAVFLGIALSITAFPVLARILRERGLHQTTLGTTALAAAALGDVSAWTLLAFVVALVQADGGGVGDAVLSAALVVAFVAAMMLGVRPLLARLVRDPDRPSRATLALIALVALGAALIAEALGIHALFGAFLAGAIAPDAPSLRARLSMRIESFGSVLLLPLFFAFTGLRTEIGLLGDLAGWLLALGIVGVATLGKVGGGALAARLAGMGRRDALRLGALLNARGLMELIALNVGYDLGILSPRIFTMLVIMALVTTILTGPLLTAFEAGGRRRASDRPGTAA